MRYSDIQYYHDQFGVLQIVIPSTSYEGQYGPTYQLLPTPPFVQPPVNSRSYYSSKNNMAVDKLLSNQTKLFSFEQMFSTSNNNVGAETPSAAPQQSCSSDENVQSKSITSSLEPSSKKKKTKAKPFESDDEDYEPNLAEFEDEDYEPNLEEFEDEDCEPKRKKPRLHKDNGGYQFDVSVFDPLLVVNNPPDEMTTLNIKDSSYQDSSSSSSSTTTAAAANNISFTPTAIPQTSITTNSPLTPEDSIVGASPMFLKEKGGVRVVWKDTEITYDAWEKCYLENLSLRSDLIAMDFSGLRIQSYKIKGTDYSETLGTLMTNNSQLRHIDLSHSSLVFGPNGSANNSAQLHALSLNGRHKISLLINILRGFGFSAYLWDLELVGISISNSLINELNYFIKTQLGKKRFVLVLGDEQNKVELDELGISLNHANFQSLYITEKTTVDKGKFQNKVLCFVGVNGYNGLEASISCAFQGWISLAAVTINHMSLPDIATRILGSLDVQDNRCVSSISLMNCNLSSAYIPVIAEKIQPFPVTSLSLSGNKIDAKSPILGFISSMTSLHQLDLSANCIRSNDSFFSMSLNVLSGLTSLKSLDLSNNEIAGATLNIAQSFKCYVRM